MAKLAVVQNHEVLPPWVDQHGGESGAARRGGGSSYRYGLGHHLQYDCMNCPTGTCTTEEASSAGSRPQPPSCRPPGPARSWLRRGMVMWQWVENLRWSVAARPGMGASVDSGRRCRSGSRHRERWQGHWPTWHRAMTRRGEMATAQRRGCRRDGTLLAMLPLKTWLLSQWFILNMSCIILSLFL